MATHMCRHIGPEQWHACRSPEQCLRVQKLQTADAATAECVFAALGYQYAFERLLRDWNPDGAEYLTAARSYVLKPRSRCDAVSGWL